MTFRDSQLPATLVTTGMCSLCEISLVLCRSCRSALPITDFILGSLSSNLQDKTNNVIDLYKDILRAVEDLATCSYTSEAFSELLGKIQSAVSITYICQPGGLSNIPRRLTD